MLPADGEITLGQSWGGLRATGRQLLGCEMAQRRAEETLMRGIGSEPFSLNAPPASARNAVIHAGASVVVCQDATTSGSLEAVKVSGWTIRDLGATGSIDATRAMMASVSVKCGI